MTTNILQAIKYIIDNPIREIVNHYTGRNRINSVGAALEKYIKDVFAKTLHETDENIKIQKYEKVFSYFGNQNNPPDMILKNGDSIEVKKVQGNPNVLALNSSYPKSKLYSDNAMLTVPCRTCEDWVEKDIIYIVGNTDNNNLKTLWFVYGDCYAADSEIYERIKNTIINGVNSIPNIELTRTNELGKIKKVDPLKITDLRVRGMWSIHHPNRVFSYLQKMDLDCSCKVFCLMKTEKFNSFAEHDRSALLNIQNNNFKISDVKIKNPNNPAKLIDAKFMEFYYA